MRTRRERVALLALVVASVGAGSAGSARATVVLGQVDDFQAGTSALWGGGSGPLVQDNGGPAGAGDRFLQQTADGSGSGGKLSMYNHDQWIGDYTTAGVTAIEMDLKNFSTQSLSMRIAFKEGLGPSAPGYSFTTAITLPNDGDWHHAVFSLDAAKFTTIGAPSPFAGIMGGLMQEFRILHSTTPSLSGNNITGSVGVDNIRAIPSPGAGSLALAGVLAGRRRRRR